MCRRKKKKKEKKTLISPRNEFKEIKNGPEIVQHKIERKKENEKKLLFGDETTLKKKRKQNFLLLNRKISLKFFRAFPFVWKIKFSLYVDCFDLLRTDDGSFEGYSGRNKK